MLTNTFTVTSVWTQGFDIEVNNSYVLYLKEQSELECSGMIRFSESGNVSSGNVIQNIDNRGVVNISRQLPTTFNFAESLSRTYELRKSVSNKLEIRLTTGTDMIVTFSLFYGGIEKIGIQPHATISDSTSQFVSSTTNEQVITFDTNESLNLITHTVSTSSIAIQIAGTYRIEILAQLSGAIANIDIWVRKNGVDIPRTNHRKSLQSANDYTLLSITFTQTAVANDYYEVVQSSTDILAGLVSIPSQVNPVRPATPSIVFVINKISD